MSWLVQALGIGFEVGPRDGGSIDLSSAWLHAGQLQSALS